MLENSQSGEEGSETIALSKKVELLAPHSPWIWAGWRSLG